MRFDVVAGHQVGHGEPLFIDPVQREEQPGQRKVLIDKTFRLPAFSKTIEVRIEGRDGLVPMPGTVVQDDAGAEGEVEVPTHQHISFRGTGDQGGTAVADRIGLRFGQRVESLGKKPNHVVRQFTGSAATALLHQRIKPVVAFEFHVIQALVQFLDGQGSFHEGPEQDPRKDEGRDK